MTRKHQSVFGLYPDQPSVDDAVEALRQIGFRNTDIAVLIADNRGTKDFAHAKHSKAPEIGAAAGAGGAVLGGAFGWLAGMGTLAVPGLEAVAVAGPVLGMLSGVGVGSTLAGLAGALAGSSLPEYEAKRYEGRIRKGGILLSVHCDEAHWVAKARRVLKQTGAEGISTGTEELPDQTARETYPAAADIRR